MKKEVGTKKQNFTNIIIFIILILLIVSIITMWPFKSYKIIETKTFSEIPGFSFEYPVFKGWEVTEIKKTNENEYYIFLKSPLLTDVAPSIIIKKNPNINYMHNIPGLSYSINPNKVKYYPIGSSESSESNNIIFFSNNEDFVIEINPFMHKGDGYSGKVLAQEIIESFKFEEEIKTDLTFDLNQKFRLKINQTAELNNTNLSMRLLDIKDIEPITIHLYLNWPFTKLNKEIGLTDFSKFYDITKNYKLELISINISKREVELKINKVIIN